MGKAVSDQSERWEDVGQAIEARIIELGLTKAEVLRRGQLSFKTLAAYMAGEPIRRPDKARGIAEALEWPKDAIARIRAGEDPADFGPVASPASLRAGSDDDVEIAALAGLLPPAQQQAVKDLIRSMLRGV